MDIWRSDAPSWDYRGYRIVKKGPRRFVIDPSGSTGQQLLVSAAEPRVSAVDETALPTLAASKFVVRELIGLDRLRRRRNRLLAVSVLALGPVAVMAPSPVTLVMLAVGGAALLELMMTWFDGRVGGARDISQ